jgi:hypothetical protein
MRQVCLRVVVLNKEEIIMVLHLLVHALLLLLHASLLHDVVRLSAAERHNIRITGKRFSKDNPRGTHVFQPGLRISGFNRVSGSRRPKMAHKHSKKLRNFMVWSTGCSLLRAEGFFCNLDVLYGGLAIGKL